MSQHRRITFVAIEIALLAIFLSYRHGIVNFRKLTWLHSANYTLNPPSQNSTNSSNLADQLFDEVRILCWVMTTPANHKIKAVHVRRTWGRRCNRLLFVTSQSDEELGETLIISEIEDTYQKIWGKTRLAFEQIYHRYGDDMDWFYKADDDTFAFIENMRYLLYPYSPEMPIYFGHNFKYNGDVEQVYMSGGSGYVLSRESLRRFVEMAIINNTDCDAVNDQQAEDVAMGQCLRAVNVIAGDSRDIHGELRFFPFEPYSALMEFSSPDDFWFFDYSFYNPRACKDCLSKYPVAFHYISPETMYLIEFFAYEFRAHDLPEESEYLLPRKLTGKEVVIRKPDNIWDIVQN